METTPANARVQKHRDTLRMAGLRPVQIWVPDVSPSRISDVVNGVRPITADTALRLGIYFSMEPRFWLNLQSEYDMRMVTRELQAIIAPRIRVFQPA